MIEFDQTWVDAVGIEEDQRRFTAKRLVQASVNDSEIEVTISKTQAVEPLHAGGLACVDNEIRQGRSAVAHHEILWIRGSALDPQLDETGRVIPGVVRGKQAGVDLAGIATSNDLVPERLPTRCEGKFTAWLEIVQPTKRSSNELDQTLDVTERLEPVGWFAAGSSSDHPMPLLVDLVDHNLANGDLSDRSILSYEALTEPGETCRPSNERIVTSGSKVDLVSPDNPRTGAIERPTIDVVVERGTHDLGKLDHGLRLCTGRRLPVLSAHSARLAIQST